MTARYSSSGNPVVLPVPWSMVIRGAQGFTSARWYEPDDAVGPTGLISFHDGRGLIVDPIYVAALFDDLQAWLPGLTGKTATASDTAPGGIATIAKLR